jgi:hypothetical protein
MLRDAPLETKRHHGGVKLGIPGPGCLLQSLQCLVKVRYLVFFTIDDETIRLGDIHLLLKITVEEGVLDVHVMDFPVLLHRQS